MHLRLPGGDPPHVGDNPHAEAHELGNGGLLAALQECFGGANQEVNFFGFDVEPRNGATYRRTRITRNRGEAYRSRFNRIRGL